MSIARLYYFLLSLSRSHVRISLVLPAHGCVGCRLGGLDGRYASGILQRMQHGAFLSLTIYARSATLLGWQIRCLLPALMPCLLVIHNLQISIRGNNSPISPSMRDCVSFYMPSVAVTTKARSMMTRDRVKHNYIEIIAHVLYCRVKILCVFETLCPGTLKCTKLHFYKIMFALQDGEG